MHWPSSTSLSSSSSSELPAYSPEHNLPDQGRAKYCIRK